jgi:transcription elongation factor
MFNPLAVKTEDVNKFPHEILLKSFYNWKEHLFRNGFLYLPMKINKLIIEKVNASLEEVMQFQKIKMDEMLSDGDEWDTMND